jgi:hypothetical protein
VQYCKGQTAGLTAFEGVCLAPGPMTHHDLTIMPTGLHTCVCVCEGFAGRPLVLCVLPIAYSTYTFQVVIHCRGPPTQGLETQPACVAPATHTQPRVATQQGAPSVCDL